MTFFFYKFFQVRIFFVGLNDIMNTDPVKDAFKREQDLTGPPDQLSY